MEKLRINLNQLLPGISGEQDACVQRVIDAMLARKGILELRNVSAGELAELCVDFDPAITSKTQVESQVREAATAVVSRYGHLLVDAGAFVEINEASGVEHQLQQLDGVVSAAVSGAGMIRVEFDKAVTNEEQIMKVMEQNQFHPRTANAASAKDSDPMPGAHHTVHESGHDHAHDELPDDHGHDHSGADGGALRTYLPVACSLLLLLAGIAMDQLIKPAFFTGWVRMIWYALAYIPVGFPVALQGARLLFKGDVFTEFVLMTIATAGAFIIGEYPEGVAVMLFYSIGELLQAGAVQRAKRSIKALLDIRPASAFVWRNDRFVEVPPQDVQIGEVIQVKAGDKVPLDGAMLSEEGTFNTAALTGESRPSKILKGQPVLAGMISGENVVQLNVTKRYDDSSLARILTLVQEATTRKAKPEQFIRKFSRIYTPIVAVLAMLITVLPYFFVADYVFRDWLYRALIFLVISCPCALVISIPLGYFGGIGAASRNGILFKGSNYLDLMSRVNTVVMDKTGTLTKGVFEVQELKSFDMEAAQWLPMAAALESASTHPVARAVVAYAGDAPAGMEVHDLQEISGHGIQGTIGGKQVLAGNLKLMQKMQIPVSPELAAIPDTIVAVAVDGRLVGYLRIADEIREDSAAAIKNLQQRRIRTLLLSGDKQAVVDRVAKGLGIEEAFGDLLPEDKVAHVKRVKSDKNAVVAFIGDGINDAPALALSDVGIAMGGLGSDAAIETADVIIQTDQPSRLDRAIRISRVTGRIVWQNIFFAFLVKAAVLALGAGGLATMWEAVFADVGVALLAVLNAMRIQRMSFK